jgi:hypothetical protein
MNTGATDLVPATGSALGAPPAPELSGLGYPRIREVDLDPAVVTTATREERNRALVPAIIAVCVATLMTRGLALFVPLALLIPPVRKSYVGWLDGRARVRALQTLLVRHQLAVRTQHEAVSPVLHFAGQGAVVLSYLRGAMFVSNAATGVLVGEFHASTVRAATVGVRTQNVTTGTGAQARTTSVTVSVLGIHFRDAVRPLVELSFGANGAAAREWESRLQALIAAAPPASAPIVVQREIRETIREVVKIRCKYCGGMVDQGVVSCTSCGARM